MKTRLLYISNIAAKRMTGSFNGTAVEAAHELDLEFISVANRSKSTELDTNLDEEKWGIKLLHIDLARSPYALRQNYKAYKQLVKIINDYEIEYIHCNTPVGGILGRLAGKKCKVKRVIYQVHGFQFYKGAPKKNWLLYYPIEKWLAKKTDALITINKEDFERAKKFKLRNNGDVYYIPGVGIKTELYSQDENKVDKREKLEIAEDDFVIIAVGRLEKNKNCRTLIEAVAKLKESNIKLVFCGDGPDHEELTNLAKERGIEEKVLFLGNHSDMPELYQMADCLALASFREGLSRTIMEAMASGLPCVVSKIRGNIDLIDEKGGFLCNPQDCKEFSDAFSILYNNPNLRLEMREYNKQKVQFFSFEKVVEEMEKIYRKEFGIVKGDDSENKGYMA